MNAQDTENAQYTGNAEDTENAQDTECMRYRECTRYKECTRYRECIRYGENIIKIEQYILCCIVCNVTVIYCEYHYFHFLDTTYMSSLPQR